LALRTGCDIGMKHGVLKGKCIVLGVTGSIAATEVVRLCHQLRREGAVVQGVMTPAACGIISPEALTYASGRATITRCSGNVEHVEYCGEGGKADLLLVAPCTANTIGKIACGIDDTPVTTFATTAVGRGIPVVIAPAMHESMYRHPAVKENLDRLVSWGIDIIPPRIEEGRAKIAGIEEILLYTKRALGGRLLSGKHVLITSGACREPLDDVRVLTTRSTGLMGRAIALEAFRLGADVTVVHSDSFPCIRNIPVSTADEMRAAVLNECSLGTVDYYISASAISDFAPERVAGKIPSGKPVTINLCPLPKLFPQVCKNGKGHLVTVAFKMGTGVEGEARAMVNGGAGMVVINSPDVMGSAAGDFVLLTGDNRDELRCTKEELAGELWKRLL
jgi:phosphopantothenoylcysteine decarboxylase / phosphopantothenate---cysteine ligase